MESVKTRFLQGAVGVSTLLSGAGPILTPAAVVGTPNIFQRFSTLSTSSTGRNRAVAIAWGLLLVVLIVVSAILIFGIGALTTKHVLTIGLLCPIWGVVLGTGAALFLPAKWLTALFGALFGLDVSALSGSAILDRVVAALNAVVSQLSAWLPDVDVTALRWYVILVVAGAAFACLPAFSSDE